MTAAQKALKELQYPSDIAPLILYQSSLHIMQLHFLNLAHLFCLLPLTRAVIEITRSDPRRANI